MIVLGRRSNHVPLATRLLGHPVVGVTAEATAHFIVRVLCQVFREIAGALAPSDHGDHPGVPRYCLRREGCRGVGDCEVARWRGGRVGSEGESREGQGGEAASTSTSVVVWSLEGTAGVEVFHGAIDGFVHWRREGLIVSHGSNDEHIIITMKPQDTFVVFSAHLP